ncbi:MAG TPA: LD-carboxypeptidase [Bacteroidales bacterium]|jgi:muramoyltetrapeptide carboxypeptidase|nr:LD-carboxypeptidase [Lentimicrobiaceae bacterium]MDY0026090.1 LD-carboxypeptidase [Lentimicrobium sp.]HAH57224.1 LD-carboxypeptidase [Bacteroidales bacterium]
MRTPPFLKSGDKVGMVATARKISLDEVEPALHLYESWGLEVVQGKNLFNEAHQLAGNDKERAADMQQMLDDPAIKAIFCARGGYGTIRIIDLLDFRTFESHPKWIVGFSDVTVLHSHIHKHFGIETLHATMPLNFPKDGSEDVSTQGLKKCLFGETPEYKLTARLGSRSGHAQGVVVGGNLSILYSLRGTPDDINTEGKILFIEDLDEYLYHVDRMIMNLKRGGMLDRLAGLVVGGMTDMRDNAVPFGKTAEEIIASAIAEYSYPVIFGFPAGHLSGNQPIILGREATLSVGAEAELLFKPPGETGSKHYSAFVKPVIFISGFFILLYLIYQMFFSII